MNLHNNKDFEIAGKLRRLINLGGSFKDLYFFYPDFFGYSQTGALAKAKRVYHDLRPDRPIAKPNRAVNFQVLVRPVKNIRPVTNFALIVYSAICDVKHDMDLKEVFVDIYEAWLTHHEESTESPVLNFQKAFAVYEYVVTATQSKYNYSLIIDCEKCSSKYIFIDAHEGTCPYCR
ncbi:MAG: hypothetical protein GW898_10395 [Thiomicrospira sp.]|nr:hypothetical protein [Thiomicrospira sp.]NCN66312.1 hypothetical protein [Thiomicrospira sp.]NCO14765.1 hypothetical protein [Thiomicrospira sp.]NCO82362.1 hypothetical protein [Thiomicrospira sp.]OIP95509.1 MAG: hypothetical protein AUK56_05560 [Thiomicrospira sp. CG2_30_44_34]